MTETVDEPWTKEVDHVNEKGDADLERRTGYLSLQDISGELSAIA
ncbi:hypothetical protein [Natrinema soli]|uniref:Uncharacterized protein n=1 Tax=Natrinema soli TaxID=1930624 RepID=A0ABD5SIU8_9EURY|nr:hypothetical protein [Natrinema soli]